MSNWLAPFLCGPSRRYYMQERYREYRTSSITNNLSNSKLLWSQVSSLLEPRQPSSTYKHTADDFANHVRNKVDTISNAMQNSPVAVIQPRATPAFDVFRPTTPSEVSKIIMGSPDRLIRRQLGSSSDCAQCCLARSRASATRRSLRVYCRRARSTPSSDRG